MIDSIGGMSIPVIDFAPFYHSTKSEQAQLAIIITRELRKNGAVRLTNHGIPAETISKCYEWVSCISVRVHLDNVNARIERVRLMSHLVPIE